jgi:hypothetical protein
VVVLVDGERRSSAPRRPTSSLAAPRRKGDHDGHTDSVVKYSEVGLTGKGKKVAVMAQNLSRSVKLWFPTVDRKSKGAVGGDLRMSWRKGEHGSEKAMAAVV